MRYWIKDEDKTPQGFPLRLLFQLIVQQLDHADYKLWILRSEGYGLKVNEWEKILDSEDRLLIDVPSFEEVSAGDTEWFYNLDAEIVTDKMQIKFGLHDTTALYIEAPEGFAQKTVSSFDHVQISKEK